MDPLTSIPDEKLFEHAHRLKGKVVVITGAANGIGKQTAEYLSSHGARVVIGDYDLSGAQNTVSLLKSKGGQAIAVKTDVTVYEQQVALFERAIKEYGAVDVVIANAGVTEVGNFQMSLGSDGKPVKPNTTTINVNLLGSVYTAYLSQHYLQVNRNKSKNDLKSLVLLGSIASWQSIPGAPMYTSSKHGVLGVMSSLHPLMKDLNIRISVVCPFFADTAIVPAPVKLFLAGIPLVPVPKVAKAIICSATHPDPDTSGCAWLLLDNGNVTMLQKGAFKEGVYGMLDKRVNRLLKGASGLRFWASVATDVGGALKRPLLFAAAAGVAYLARDKIPVAAQDVQDALEGLLAKFTK